MKFQKKILITYIVFIGIILLIFANIFITITKNFYEEKDFQTIENLSKNLSSNYDYNIEQMNSAFEFLLSDIGVLDSIKTLSVFNSSDINEYTNTAKSDILNQLNTYYLSENFYRVVFTNKNGFSLSSYNYNNREIDYNLNANDMFWEDTASLLKNKFIYLSPHTDTWGLSYNPQVYSLVKKIQGDNLGYIEVQQLKSTLKNIFLIEDDNIYIQVVYSNKNLIYQNININNDEINFYSNTVESHPNTRLNLNYKGEEKILTNTYSPYSDSYIILIKDRLTFIDIFREIYPVFLIILFLIIIVSALYSIIVTKYLTKTLKILKYQFQNTEIEQLEMDVEINSSDNEVLILYGTYKQMLLRIKNGIEKEKQIHTLQLQAQFDTLQAQVNPHFLYNILNVVSYRGVLNDDEIICDICDTLAEMLRYSTNTKENYSTIKNEIENVQNYFYLLEKRYERKLQYNISIDEELYDIKVPKIYLQQLIENSILHGYENINGIIEIELIGKKHDNYWEIYVSDNGIGFDVDVINELTEKMNNIRKTISKGSENIKLEIGGMGIINIYARFYFLFGDIFSIRFENSDKTKIIFRVNNKD